MRKRIAQQIEANKERADQEEDQSAAAGAVTDHGPGKLSRYRGKRYSKLGKSPNSHTAVGGRYGERKDHSIPRPWTPPPGTNKRADMARIVAQAVFENNPDKLYQAYAVAALKGNGYVFTQLAERAYGKLKEHVMHEVTPFSDFTDEQLRERYAQLEAECIAVAEVQQIGRATSVDGSSGTSGRKTSDPPRVIQTPSTSEN